MSGKTRMNTRKHLHAARLRAIKDRKAELHEGDTGFRYRHDAEMRKQLKGIDPGRTEALSEHRQPS